MLDVLEFAYGAIPSNETILPIFTHFMISDGRVQASNGRIAIDAPIKSKLSTCVPAERFIKAVKAGGKSISMGITDGGKLSIKGGSLRVLLPLMKVADYPKAEPSTGKRNRIKEGLVGLLKNVRPFIGDDATRPWVSNVVFDKDLVLTTSNVCISGFSAKGFVPFTIPIFAVEELLRIGEEPVEYALDETSITFFWEDSWLKSQTISGEWPIDTVLQYLSTKTKPKPVPAGLGEAVEKLIPFCADPKHPVIHFSENGVSTSAGETQAEVEGFALEPICFDARNLIPILKVATKAELRGGERPVGFFYGDHGFRAVLAGLTV